MVTTNATRTVERRQAARFQPAFGTCCRYREGGDALVWDLSAGGVGLLTGRPPALGELVAAELTNGAATLFISVRAVHVRILETGDYFVGARFVRPLTRQELEPFVTPHPGMPFRPSGDPTTGSLGR